MKFKSVENKKKKKSKIFVKKDAGNVEYNNAVFNNSVASGDCAGCSESLLTEDIASVKKQYSHIPDEDFYELISLDPTFDENKDSVGKYGKWLLGLYKKDNPLNYDGYEQITSLLNTYDKYKNSRKYGIEKDINRFKSIQQLNDAVDNVSTAELSDRQKEREIRGSKDYKQAYKDDEWTVYVPTSYEGSCALGKGTEWCTADSRTSEYYDEYIEDGPLYVIINNKNKSEKYQFHFPSKQFMDKYDYDISYSKFLVKNQPLKQFFIDIGELEADFTPFIYDGKKAIPKNVAIVEVKDGVDELHDKCCFDCDWLNSIKIPDTVDYIGDLCFSGCVSLLKLELPNTVNYIGSQCFRDCIALQSINLPQSITTVRASCFWGCVSLKSIIIPNSVRSLKAYCFERCTSLQSITISDSVRQIGEKCFDGCTALKTLKTNKGSYAEKYFKKNYPQVNIEYIDNIVGENMNNRKKNKTYVKKDAGNVPYNNEVFNSSTADGLCETSGCSESFITEGSIEGFIYDGTKKVPKDVVSVVVKDGVEVIPRGCFESCEYLKSITIPSSVVKLEDGCFSECHLLNNVEIPDSVRYIGERCFSGCKSLKSVNISNVVTHLYDYCFFACYQLEFINIPESVEYIGQSCFGLCTQLKSITIPSSVKYIGTWCFDSCLSLQSITIPKSVSKFGNKCFVDCDSLKILNTPKGSLAEKYFNKYYPDVDVEYTNDVVGESMKKGNKEAKINRYSDVLSDEDKQNGWWYFTTHGVQPGSIPKDLNVLDIKDTANGTFVKLDGILNTSELKKYDMKEKSPKSMNEARKKCAPENMNILDSGYANKDEWEKIKKEQVNKYKDKYPDVKCYLVKTDTPGLKMWQTVTCDKHINEDTIKQGNNWVNKGKDGTHGKFRTKKAADAQRKAMFANGYKESLSFKSNKDVYDIYASIDKFLRDNDFYNYDLVDYDSYPMETAKISFEISGDWKHDHWFFKDLVQDWAYANNKKIFKIDSREVGNSDSDYCTAVHDVYIAKDDDSFDKLQQIRKAFGESLNCSKNLNENDKSKKLYLYHSTYKRNLDSILNKGLSAHPSSHNWDGIYLDSGVFLALDANVAKDYATSSDYFEDDDDVVTFKVSLSDLDQNYINYDWNNRCEYHTDIDSCVYEKDINKNVLQQCDPSKEPYQDFDDFEGTELYEILYSVFDEQVETNKENEVWGFGSEESDSYMNESKKLNEAEEESEFRGPLHNLTDAQINKLSWKKIKKLIRDLDSGLDDHFDYGWMDDKEIPYDNFSIWVDSKPTEEWTSHNGKPLIGATGKDKGEMWYYYGYDCEDTDDVKDMIKDAKKCVTDVNFPAHFAQVVTEGGNVLASFGDERYVTYNSRESDYSLGKQKNLKESVEQPYFKAFITNLGKYNEGDLVGTWVEFPIDADEFNKILHDDVGIDEHYEEWFVTDYDCNLPSFNWQMLGEYASYDDLNDFGEKLSNVQDIEAVSNALEIVDNLDEVLEGLENGEISYYPGIDSEYDLGQFVIDEFYGDDIPEDLINDYFDFASLGRTLGFDSYETDEEDEDGNPIYVSAGEYWCGDENASDEEIGEAFVDEVGIDGVANKEFYFDYKEFGRVLTTQNFHFTRDGVIEWY